MKYGGHPRTDFGNNDNNSFGPTMAAMPNGRTILQPILPPINDPSFRERLINDRYQRVQLEREAEDERNRQLGRAFT